MAGDSLTQEDMTVPKPEQTGKDAAPGQTGENQGQQQVREFVNPTTGETRSATQHEFKTTLRDQGFTPAGDGEDEDEEAAAPVG